MREVRGKGGVVAFGVWDERLLMLHAALSEWKAYVKLFFKLTGCEYAHIEPSTATARCSLLDTAD